MAKLSVGQKAMRVMRFVVGVRNPRVFEALAAYGFTDADIQDGWTRLSALVHGKLRTPVPVADRQVIEALDSFENEWFPVARATLQNRYPKIAEALFANLVQTRGVAVAFSVGTFVERLGQMERGEGAFAGEGPQARDILAQRGLTPERVAQAESLLAALGSSRHEPVPNAEEQQEREAALWAWYLEWSAIARHAVKDGRLLRSMGFLKSRRASDEPEEADTEDEVPIDVETAPTLPGLTTQNGTSRALPAHSQNGSNGTTATS